MIQSFDGMTPLLGDEVFIAPSAFVLGNVRIGDRSSIWYGTIVRGDVHSIVIGESTNIQDQSVIHVSKGTYPTRIGDHVTVGHGAVIHGCSIGSKTLIGIGAIVLDGVEIGEGSLIAAGSLLPPGKTYAPRSMIVGSPAITKRTLDSNEIEGIYRSAEDYVCLARKHAEL